MSKTDLKGLSQNELEDLVRRMDEPRFRSAQIFSWIYGKRVDSFDEMTNLSKEFRERLAKSATIGQLALQASETSGKDSSTKYLFKLQDGLAVESVLMPEDGHATLCVSTQVGCAIDCKFCATGKMGLQRNLSAGEILDQVLRAEELSGQPVRNLVFMGMGEPFHNYDNLLKACEILTDESGPNLSSRKLVISTSGILPKILQYADEGHKYRLAISLNATTDEQRTALMPLNKKWPIAEVIRAVKYYTEKSNQRVTFEYVLLNSVNDSVDDARRLRKLVEGLRCKINLIPYNPAVGPYSRSPNERIQAFYEQLAGLKVPVMIRWSKGDDIAAGCGQLAVAEKGR